VEFALNAVPLFLFLTGICGLYFCIRSMRRTRGPSTSKRFLYGLGVAISVTAIGLAWLTSRAEFIFRVR
jgi:hypothetical protein